MVSSESNGHASTNGVANSNGNANPNASQSQTYAIDIRYFAVMLVSAMSVFFVIGIITAPSNPAMYSTYLTPNTDDIASTLPTPQRRAHPKHSSEIGAKVKATTGDLNERHVNFEQPSYEDLGTGEGAVYTVTNKTTSGANAASGEGEHLPAGQHLLVDIKNLEAAFLNSEERLADAMVETVKAAGLTLLSYHCHSLIPSGVSCVGVLLESHISFHTWPEEGVITLDLFTCGENPLLPVVSDLERLFGIPRVGDDGEEEQIETLWSHELRGFRHEDPNATSANYLDGKSDLATWVTSPLDYYMKKQVVSTVSDLHRIDIWDVLGHDDTPSHQDAMMHELKEGDDRWFSPEVASPNRLLFINGTLQSMSYNEEELHETLVQPAMFAHPNPVNVVIVGGAEGNSLQQVLAHNTVESITLIEPDSILIEIAREHLSFMSNCTELVGVADDCFEDERVNLVIEDAKSWFMDRFSDTPTKKSDVDKYDVVILDTLAPGKKDSLVHDETFLNAVMNSLSEDGTIAAMIGDSPTIHEPKAEFSAFASREKFLHLLEKNGNMGAMFVYEEGHTGYEVPSSFLVGCKNVNCRDLWFADAMVFDFEISKRIRESNLGSALLHYDGATQHSFQIPPRSWEYVYCRREPTPFECAYRGLDLSKELYEIVLEEDDDNDESSFKIEIEEGENGKQKTSIVALEDIPKGSYIMPSDLAASFTISEYTHNSLKSNANIKNTGDVSVIENFLQYIDDHGHETMSDGSSLKYVEVGASFMIRKSSNMDETNVGRWMPLHPSGKQPIYSPVYDRHMVSFDVFLVATRDIEEGEELVKPDNLWSV